MEKLNIDKLVSDHWTSVIRALGYKNKARAYLIIVALKQNGSNYTTDIQLGKMMGLDYTYTYQMLRWFENVGLVKRLPTKKPVKFAFMSDLEDPEYVKIAKNTLGLK